MKFLSARRRHPAAGIVVVLFALVALGGVYAVAAPSKQASADEATSTQIEEGKKLFAVSCTSCHGPAAEGVEDMGPSLIGVGAAAVDFQVGTGRMPAKQPGVRMPPKETEFTDEEIAALSAYVASLGPGPEIPAPEDYDTSQLTEEEIGEGSDLFKTNCAGCHNVTGKGGAMPWGNEAPNLGSTDPKHIFEAMETGPNQMPVFAGNVIETEEKQKIIGYLEQLREEPEQGGMALGGLGPVPEGGFAWVVGLGSLVLATIWITAKGSRAKKKEAK